MNHVPEAYQQQWKIWVGSSEDPDIVYPDLVGPDIEGPVLILEDEKRQIVDVHELRIYEENLEDDMPFETIVQDLIDDYVAECEWDPRGTRFAASLTDPKFGVMGPSQEMDPVTALGIEGAQRALLPILVDEDRTWIPDDAARMPFADLTVVYAFASQEDDLTWLVSDALRQQWGVTVEELHERVVANDATDNPPCVIAMIGEKQTLSDNLYNADRLSAMERPAYLTTSRLFQPRRLQDSNGASVILRDGVLRQVGKLLGSDFYLLPVTRSECVICGVSDVRVSDLEDLIARVAVEPDVIPLSGKILRCDRFGKRMKQVN